MEDVASNSIWRRLNFWKIAFFVMLVLFELAREIAVLESTPEPKIATLASVFSVDGYIRAKGRWERTDGGSPIVPGATNITCDQDKGQCVEVTATILDGYLGDPDVDTFDATFTPEAVNYENDNPICAKYSVRIDLKIKKVFALRERNANVSGPLCNKMEPKVEMTLGDGYRKNDNPLGDHFVPIIRLVGWFFQ